MNTWCPIVCKIHFKVKRWSAKQHKLKRRKRMHNSNSCIEYFKQSIQGIYRIDWIYFYFIFWPHCLSSVQFSDSVVSDSLRPRTDYSTPGFPVITNSRSLLKLMPTELVMPSIISSSVFPFSFCPQSFPASGSFPMSQFFASGGQSIGVSVSSSVLPMNIYDWFLLGWTGWNSLKSKGLSRVFSNTTFQKHRFFGTQFSLWSNSHIHTWLLEKPWLGPLSAKECLCFLICCLG